MWESVLNESPSSSQTANVTVSGYLLATTGTWFQFGLTNFLRWSHLRNTGGSRAVEFPPGKQPCC